ncbi:hypothetical protein Bca4012_037482 [Brassica carinata]
MERDDESRKPMMEMCNNRGGEETSNRRLIISGEPLDIESYSMLYKGRTKIMRLLFIESHYGGNQMLQLEALRMAHDDIKKGENTQLFRDLVNRINGGLDKTLLALVSLYAVRGQLTCKADIYSFGVLLMEIVSARSNKYTRLPTEYQYLLERAWELYERNELVWNELSKVKANHVHGGEAVERGEGYRHEENNQAGLISDFMDLKVRGPVKIKPNEVNRNNNYTDPSSYNASSSSGTRDNSNAYSLGASSAAEVSSFSSTI